MEEREIRLRLIEAAAQLAIVRALIQDSGLAAATATAIAGVWYTYVIGEPSKIPGQPDKAQRFPKIGLPKSQG